MVYAERGNSVYQIADTDIQRYLDLGYDITDGKGTVLKRAVPSDINVLKSAFITNGKRIEELENKIRQLNALVSNLNATIVDKDNMIAELQSKVTSEPKRSRKPKANDITE